jgi:immune inhibitor A
VLKTIVILLIILFVNGCSSGGSAAIDAVNTPAVSSFTPGVQLAESVSAGTPMPAPKETIVEVIPTATVLPKSTQTLRATHEATIKPTLRANSTAEPGAAVSVDRFHALSLELAQAVPPARDDSRLAAAFKGLDQGDLSTRAPLLIEPLVPGQRQIFTVLDVVNNTYSDIEAQLYAVGEHAYFWFETEPYGLVPDEDDLSEIVSVFDEIYDGVTADFGIENSPGIDGDPRLHILNASPQTICGVDGEGNCGTAGFVSSPDLLPAALNPQSNEREMFIMNDRQFGSDFYLGVLAHEFRHLIEFNYDLSDTDWEKEGSAVLASDLFGLPSGGLERANMFLREPDQQLNSWTETGKGVYYGQAYLFNQYLFDRLGASLYREFAMSPLPGFVALDDLANRHSLNQTGQSLWLDWLTALVIHDNEGTEEKYKINAEGLETAAMVPINTLPGKISGEVRQFAADYYQLPSGTVNLAFNGADIVSLLAGQEPTDEVFWYAQRANYSNPRLTRSIDLRNVETATLVYDVYTDIEQAYDFAYVSVSLDGGNRWIPLEAPNMQGLAPEDDPSGSALADRFYSGRDQTWKTETVDLTPYAGQEIMLRFEMVTDPILTYSGMAIDNISVPEISYFDDGIVEGWTAEGFSLATSSLPQPWHLQVITFPGGSPQVTELPVSPDGRSAFVLSSEGGQPRPILIIAASAPMTLEPALYELQLEAG